MLMKFKFNLNAYLCGTMAVLAMAGCSDDALDDKGGNVPQGNGIVFGASANYADGSRSRTEYGDYEYADGKKVSQEIHWLTTDYVDIYSPTSPTKKQVEYGIQNVNGNQAYLSALGDGLQWARSETTQDFYAVYPSKNSIKNEQIKGLVSFKNGTLTGYVPVNQEPVDIVTDAEGNLEVKPNMDYLYMTAINKGFNIPAPESNGGISLDFVPLTSTLEITLVGPTDADIVSVNVNSLDGEPIAGSFTCDLVNGKLDSDGYPVCEYAPSATVRSRITVSTYHDYEDGKGNVPLKLASGQKVKFNVFLLPHTNLDNLSVSVVGLNTKSMTVALNQAGVGEDIVLHPHKKTCITLGAPIIKSGEVNTWITNIDDDVLVSQLSIPGTANSFSNSYNGDNPEWYKTQTTDITTQWNAGIRCFELTGTEGSGSSLEDAPLQCNRTSINKTFGAAVKEIWDLLQKNPGEFAMIIPSYDSDTGHPGGVENYANRLNRFFTDHATTYDYATFTRKLTVRQARGKLIFIARITSEEDRGQVTMPAPVQGTFVDEWGSLKDNWERRGYTYKGSVVNNWGTGGNDQNSVEYYMHQTIEGSYWNSSWGTENDGTIDGSIPTSRPVRVEANVNFIHTSKRAGSAGTGEAYIQDWQRVVPRNGVVAGLREGNFYLGRDYNYTYYTYHYYWWPESLTEKENDIWNTFLKAIDSNSQAGNDVFFINSLDGYFVDPNIPLSYTPYVAGTDWGVALGKGGTAGNIEAYATYINNYFYNRILGYGEDKIYGPMNIVLFDRAYEEGGGEYLPSVVINNNFRFPLGTATETGATNSLNASGSYASGGNVWE